MNTWGDKVRAVVWGPSWEPGTPRLGDEAEKIDVSIFKALQALSKEYYLVSVRYR